MHFFHVDAKLPISKLLYLKSPGVDDYIQNPYNYHKLALEPYEECTTPQTLLSYEYIDNKLL